MKETCEELSLIASFNVLLHNQASAPADLAGETDCGYAACLEVCEGKKARVLAAIRERCGHNAEPILSERTTVAEEFEKLHTRFISTGSGTLFKLVARFHDLTLSSSTG
ncbi:hypothetical protein K470DRAFT_266494 [Piedraia hortae CBS 480.64]|uniref:Uncharacterized protein n=1 Tax=Piedraia hortae CBS 480.64 TaxID=1314780 RepID=A0A6A7BRQ4_9PEZI|nr:hypothetical protein K470DRAFT_266494 [Piedraia hortae CBS 480.64]